MQEGQEFKVILSFLVRLDQLGLCEALVQETKNKETHTQRNKQKKSNLTSSVGPRKGLAEPLGCYSSHYLNTRVSAATCLAPCRPVRTHLLPPRALSTQKVIDWASVLLCLCELPPLHILQKSQIAQLKRGLRRGHATHGFQSPAL